jgi:hypothetical protein
VVERVDRLLASDARLPAAVRKNLRVAQQEVERCLRARRKAA